MYVRKFSHIGRSPPRFWSSQVSHVFEISKKQSYIRLDAMLERIYSGVEILQLLVTLLLRDCSDAKYGCA